MGQETHYLQQRPRQILDNAVCPDSKLSDVGRLKYLFLQRLGQPAVSVDTKKKDMVGPFRNGGRAWYCKGGPARVNVDDFPDSELG